MDDFSMLTNAELLDIYESVTDMAELDPLMNEMMNRLAWYIAEADVPLADTAAQTYLKN